MVQCRAQFSVQSSYNGRRWRSLSTVPSRPCGFTGPWIASWLEIACHSFSCSVSGNLANPASLKLQSLKLTLLRFHSSSIAWPIISPSTCSLSQFITGNLSDSSVGAPQELYSLHSLEWQQGPCCWMTAKAVLFQNPVPRADFPEPLPVGFSWKQSWRQTLLLLLLFWRPYEACRILVLQLVMEPTPCVVEGLSLPHWTSREAPVQRPIPWRHWFGKCALKYGSRKRKTEKNEKVISKCTNKVTPWSYIMSPRFPCYCRKGWNTYAMVPISLWMVMSLDY